MKKGIHPKIINFDMKLANRVSGRRNKLRRISNSQNHCAPVISGIQLNVSIVLDVCHLNGGCKYSNVRMNDIDKVSQT